jgi:hypothetical protein
MLSAGPAPGADNFVIVAGEQYDAHSRDPTPALLKVSGVDAVHSLWTLLTDWDLDAPEDAALMEPVRLTVCFRQSRVPVVSVGLKSRSVHSERWGPYDRLLRCSGLSDWLAEQGIDLTHA